MNKNIADLLSEIAAYLELEDFPTARFEIRAYQKAAMTIGTLQEPIEDIYRKGGVGSLMALPGVGKSIASLIEEYIKTGRSKKYDTLRKKYPIDMAGLTSIQGVGAKKALTLYKKLGITDVEGLKKALAQHKIAELDGFGEKSEEIITKGLQITESSKGRMLLGEALPVAEAMIAKLKGSGLVERALVAGSARRMRETVGDLDILAISARNEKVMDFFIGMEEVSSVVQKGPTKSTVMLKIGISCDLRVLEPASFGAAVQYFTGSRDHNIQVRTIAVNKRYKLNEYGLFDRRGRNIAGPEEEGIYEKLGMQWMPPEMREARGEVKLAQEHKIPRLVASDDIAGDMHTHTKETDGSSSLEEMVDAAMKAGYKYMAITNHTKSLYIAKGMDDRQFAEFFKRVDRLQDSLDSGFTIFKGVELDILKDGSLDLKAETLRGMDVVVAAVHQNTGMSEEQMTRRVERALDSGLVSVLAHPTGRLIGEREPYKVDLEKVFECAERNGVALEINAFPNRTDLNDTNIMLASKYKVMFSIGTDSHSVQHLRFMRYGVGTARRGWLGPERVVNTMTAKRLLGVLKVG